MVEGTTKQSLDGKTVETVTEPPCYIQVAQFNGSLLAFDDPAYGPIAYAVHRDDVARIVRVLSAHLALPAGQTDELS